MKVLPIIANTPLFKSKEKKQKFDYNHIDNNGVHIFEKVIRSERKELLPYFFLTEDSISFTPGMLDAYKNIKNAEFKETIENSPQIFMRFPELEKAIQENDSDGIRNGIKILSECKFCNRFRAMFLLASRNLQEADSVFDKYSRSIAFVKAMEEFMPKSIAHFYLRSFDTFDYVAKIKKIIQHPEQIDIMLKQIKGIKL